MAFRVDKPKAIGLTIDKEGYRSYKVSIRVVSDGTLTNGLPDGPGTALLTPGLPVVGSPYSGYEATDDFWCWCQQNATAHPARSDGGNLAYDCEFEFSNKPAPTNKQRCNTAKIEDPLLEPQKMSLHFTKAREEATADRFGSKLLTSSHEQIRGPQVEFDEMQPSVKIEQNVSQLEPELLAYVAANPLNDAPLWGLPARCVKVSEISAEEKFQGTCEYYYTRHLSLEAKVRIDPKTGAVTSGWDRDLVDEGTKVLRGHWSESSADWILDDIDGLQPNPMKPTHFIRYQDRNGNTARVILDGAGKPYVPLTVDDTSDCEGCPDGMPVSLEVLIGGPTPVTITHVGGCEWFGQDNDPLGVTTYTLTFEHSDDPDTQDAWTLTAESPVGTNSWVYVTPKVGFPGAVWNCHGPNVMTRTSEDGPSNLTVTPTVYTEPGKRHVERYGESNLLLLRIPLVLGTPTPP